MPFKLPRLYPILDRAFLPPEPAGARLEALATVVGAWFDAGITLLQYRNKQADARPREALADAREILRIASRFPQRPTLVFNDRADLALAASFDGVHIGQDDLPPAAVRSILGPDRIYGLSCHNPAQIAQADATDADYLAIGPIFPTASKANPDPVLGLEGLRAARRLTSKPLVAIGGITLEHCRPLLDSGADSVALLSALLAPAPGGRAPNSVADFLRVLR